MALGAKEKQLMRLLRKTIPTEHDYLENFIPDNVKTYDQYKQEVIKVLGDKPQNQMAAFIGAHRSPGENLLAYLSRLLKLYQAANNFGNDWW